MKAKILRRPTMLVLGILALAALAGCSLLVSFDWTKTPPYAMVKDEAGVAIASVVVTLTPSSGTALTATSGTDGTATFTGFTSSNAATYTMSAALAGSSYQFASSKVTVGENTVFLGTIVGVSKTATVTGTVVDARINPNTTGSVPAIAGATVTLYTGTTAGPTATSATDGTFSFTNVAPGSYRIGVVKATYAFIDKNVELAQIGSTVNIGKVLGFTSAGSEISLIAVWSATFNDVDAHLTIPPDDPWTSSPPFTDPYQATASGSTTGFLPTTGREDIYFSHKTSTATVGWFAVTSDATPAVSLDADNMYGSGPETITIKSLPLHATTLTYNTTGAPTTNGLPTDTYLYAWVGVAEFYVYAYPPNTTLSTAGQPGGAQVEVYVVQGSSVKGRFVLPDYITIRTASVIRINMFVKDGATSVTPYYQFVPDVRIADYTGFRGLVTNAPLVLAGAPRAK